MQQSVTSFKQLRDPRVILLSCSSDSFAKTKIWILICLVLLIGLGAIWKTHGDMWRIHTVLWMDLKWHQMIDSWWNSIRTIRMTHRSKHIPSEPKDKSGTKCGTITTKWWSTLPNSGRTEDANNGTGSYGLSSTYAPRRVNETKRGC